MQLALELHTHDVWQAHHGGAAQHHAFGFKAAHAHGDNSKGVYHGGVAVGSNAGVRIRNTVAVLNHRRHLLQVDLVHDAVARRNHIHVLERRLGPVDEVETVVVAAVFHGTVFLERVFLETGVLNGQRVIHD